MKELWSQTNRGHPLCLKYLYVADTTDYLTARRVFPDAAGFQKRLRWRAQM